MPVVLFSLAIASGIASAVLGTTLGDVTGLVVAFTGLTAAIGGAVGIWFNARKTKVNTGDIKDVSDRVDTIEANGNGGE